MQSLQVFALGRVSKGQSGPQQRVMLQTLTHLSRAPGSRQLVCLHLPRLVGILMTSLGSTKPPDRSLSLKVNLQAWEKVEPADAVEASEARVCAGLLPFPKSLQSL